jgi:hypothetical protein
VIDIDEIVPVQLDPTSKRKTNTWLAGRRSETKLKAPAVPKEIAPPD